MITCSFETLWIMDLSSGLIKEVVKGLPFIFLMFFFFQLWVVINCLHHEGSAKILEICGSLVLNKSSLLKEIPSNILPSNMGNKISLEYSRTGLVSSVATFQDNIVICDSGKYMVADFAM